MKTKHLAERVLLVLATGWTMFLSAQPTSIDKHLVEETKSKATKGNPDAQFNLGFWYYAGHASFQGFDEDWPEAVKWFRKAGEQGHAKAERYLGNCYQFGIGVTKDLSVATEWYRKAADQGEVEAQECLGNLYENGDGVTQDYTEAVNWYRRSSDHGLAEAQFHLGLCYANGKGVPADYVEAHRWFNLARAQGFEEAKRILPVLESRMTFDQISEAQKLARLFKPTSAIEPGSTPSLAIISDSHPIASGTGFFITEDGYLITNEHVVRNSSRIRLLTKAGFIPAQIVIQDSANDFALLKADGTFKILSLAPSRSARMGSTVATVGFPNFGMQGFAPKLARGEVAALSGPHDDPKYFQISVPVQPGNSGGALVNEQGNVIGVVSAKLNASAALALSGSLPENVNYAVKSSFLLGFLESSPEVPPKLREPNTRTFELEELAKLVEEATVLVLVY